MGDEVKLFLPGIKAEGSALDGTRIFLSAHLSATAHLLSWLDIGVSKFSLVIKVLILLLANRWNIL